MKAYSFVTGAAFCLFFAVSSVANAATDSELAKATQNPVADLISVPFQNNTNFNYGIEDRTQNILNIQPVIPVNLNDEWNLITRTIVPVISQPGFTSDQSRQDGIGDTSFTAFLSPSDSGGWVWGAGPVAVLPTASDDRLGQDQWGVGPSLVFLTMPGNWVVGSLFSQVWDAGGWGDDDVNFFTWQYFVNYNLPNGWYLSSAPINTADWAADSDNRFTVPVGGGLGKIVRIGKLPLNIQMQGFNNVERPNNGAEWTLRTQVQFLFPK